MYYDISYACVSHIGKIRTINQDNFVCDRHYMEVNGETVEFPLCGVKSTKENSVFGIFDGMGGEEYGEIASYIAAKDAKNIEIGKKSVKNFMEYCQKANNRIFDYAIQNGISSMGTTAAMVGFTKKNITICNIGDSKIFRFSEGRMEQISKDHVVTTQVGGKPPLSQNLGIPPSEFIIDPYLAQGKYKNKDLYLICSDGLTDMVTTKEIKEILNIESVEESVMSLLKRALDNGGRDNITIILCKIERTHTHRGLLNRKIHMNKKEVSK